MRVEGRPKSSRVKLKERRLEAMRLLDECKSLSKVAQRLKVSVSSVHRWKEARAQSGEKGLDGKRHPGPTPRLTASQRADLEDVLVELARGLHRGDGRWFPKRVAELIQQRYNVTYKVNYVEQLLRSLGRFRKTLHDARGNAPNTWRRLSRKHMRF